MTEVPLYRIQSTDLQSKSMNWFLNGRDLRHERVMKKLMKLKPLSKNLKIWNVRYVKIKEMLKRVKKGK